MKRAFASLPIRTKIILLASLSSAMALILAGTAIAYTDYMSGKRALMHRLQTQAQITATHSAAAVAFDDADAAAHALEALRADRAIMAAEIRRADGSQLAKKEFLREVGTVHVIASIVLEQDIGTLSLWATPKELHTELARDGVVLFIVLMLALGTALGAASILQRLISGPILALANTASTVSRDRDYSLRLDVQSGDEIGQLVSSFNGMLDQIESRDMKLRQYHAELEDTVARRTAQLAIALEDAQAAARAKTDFLANMSHEIRTPMNGVIGMLELMHSENLDTQQRNMLETARSSADSLLTLINDVLDFSKIEAGKLTLESIDVDLRSLAEEVSTLFSQPAQANGVELSCFVHHDVPAVVRSDPTRLRQIISNLLGNAVKFTEEGQILLELRTFKRTESATHIGIVVRDTGIGMTAEGRKRLFTAFTQADSSTTRKYGGTGLGLTITKRLIDAMGGRIRVASKPGLGSSFCFVLPLARAEREHQPILTELDGLKALIVDDNEINRYILEHYLSAVGMTYESAASGSAGLEAAHAAVAAGKPFDVVLLDYQMPKMDAIGFLTRLRQHAATHDLAVVVLSSMGARSAEADMLDVATWLSKPVRQVDLRNALSAIFGRVIAPERVIAPKPDAALAYHGARVLLVEDNRVNQEVARRMLETFGIEPQLAVNGQEAVDCATRGEFDLVFMDCQMPVKDGYAAARELREHEHRENRRRVPIVAMTANALLGDRERCLEAGMDDYVSKPVKRSSIGDALARWLEPTAEPATEPAPREFGTQEIRMALDMDALVQLRELFEDGVADVLQTYLTDTPNQFRMMADAIRDHDYEMLQRSAHSLKASSRTFGASIVANRAEDLEELAKERGSLEQASQRLAALRSAFAVMEPELIAVIGVAGQIPAA
jgi:signal transduction histidine kinase/CheY-like chemotaxis protein/HPt (histidine-containing phosphotransfer) domain-containing protein